MNKFIAIAMTMLVILLNSIMSFATEQRVVRVGAFNYYPAIFKDADGEVKGFYVDALAELGKAENIRFEYVYGSWSEGLERIKSGEVDLLTSVAYTEERAKYMDYPKTQLMTVWGELYAPLSSELDGIREVHGKKIAVMKGDFNGINFIDLTKKFDITCEFVEFSNFEDVFRAINTKKVDAGVVNSAFGVAKQKEHGLRSTGVVFNPFDIFFTVAKGKNRSLLALVDTYLTNWRHEPDSPYNKARQKWSHGTSSTISVIPQWLINLAVALLLLAVLFAVFIFVLRKQVQNKTRLALESAKKYQNLYTRQEAILSAVPDIVMETDLDRVYVWSNNSGLEFFGEDVVGKKADFYFAGEQEMSQIVRPLFDGIEKLLYVETWQRRQDGEIRLLAWRCKSLIDQNGSVRGALSTARDITEGRMAEKNQAQQKALFEAIFSCIPDAIVYTNVEREVTGINPAYTSIFGFDMNDLAGQKTSFFYENIEEYERQGRIRYNLAAAQLALPYEVNYRKKDGTIFPGETLGTVIKTVDGAHLGYIGVIRDITERKNAQEEKTKLESQLHQSQKMDSIGRLAGGVAHDFNNMLTVILGHAQLGLMRIDPNHPVYKDFEAISATAERSADLTRQLLAFARKQTVAPKVLNLNETVSGMFKMLQRLIGENINLVWQPGSGLWQTKMDPSQLDQILANLCINARDAINETGRITIETENITIDEVYCITNSEATAGEYVRISVSDDGSGIEKESLAHIFEPFYTTKELGKGTGLGLATVYGAVKQNHGFINVYSEPENGTYFSIYLPKFYGDNNLLELKDTPVATILRGQGTLLIVEDELSILNMTSQMLEDLGYSILKAGTPGEAIRLAADNMGKIQMLITDVIMPEMNGRDLAKKLISMNPDMKSIYMSGYTADVIANHGVLDEGVHFIQKPFTLPKMAEKVREVLDGK